LNEWFRLELSHLSLTPRLASGSDPVFPCNRFSGFHEPSTSR
jgi:hypothetical protein